jgi:PQQ-dependent dehydrogenase (methanol/ethanol family)
MDALTPSSASARSTRSTRGNVGELGLAWYYDLGTTRGVEATPLVVDGVMYTTSAWSIVYALDAKTGREIWVYDPHVPKRWGQYACCDVVNRGVAAWNGRVYVGTLDGRLVAIDAATGKLAWEKTTVDQSLPYTITGAPRVVNGKVVIGNGGAEYGVRGYVTAYDAATGDQVWRFYTVPGDPAKGFEAKILEMAATTWNGEWWKGGGGGTAWDALVTTPSSTSSTSARATAAHGRATSAAPAAATICFSPRSSRSTRTRANMCGTTRPRRARTGTTRRRSR